MDLRNQGGREGQTPHKSLGLWGSWESLADVEETIYFAQKWDAQGPPLLLRSVITAPVFLE